MTRELNPGLVGGDPPPFLSAVAANILLIGASFTFITVFTFIASERDVNVPHTIIRVSSL